MKIFWRIPFLLKILFNEIRIKFKGDEKKKKEKQESALILDLKQKKLVGQHTGCVLASHTAGPGLILSVLKIFIVPASKVLKINSGELLKLGIKIMILIQILQINLCY